MPRLFELLSGDTERELRAKYRPNGKSVKKERSRESGKGPQTRLSSPCLDIPDFVALDFETTGLDPKSDRIIEIGAVRFLGGKAGEEFTTFINPGIPIPSLITQLTSIRQEDVSGAPVFSDIAQRLVDFIGSLPLCGHQIEFDANFLNEELRRLGRQRLDNALLDSASLSRLVLPALGSYGLSNVAVATGVELSNAHRALPDARASGAVAACLIPRLAEIESSVRYIMAKFAPASVLKTLLFNSLGDRRDLKFGSERALPALPRKLPVPEQTQPVDEGAVSAAFMADGGLSRIMPDFTVRPAQVQMALGVAQTLNTNTFLVAEAGTGVGKSLAYLIPAAMWAYANNTRILVSSYTRNVGDQLIKRDLPVLQQFLGGDFTYSVLKGRSNYLCVNRWRRLLAGDVGNLSPRERMGVLPLIRWAEQTQTGDVEEQNLFNRKWFGKVWGLVSAESHNCEGWRCPYADECFLQRARRKAMGSHIVVINHALFFSEICADSSFLGPIGPIVFDEAHHLEECGHRHLRVELDNNRMNRFLDSLDSLLKSISKDSSQDKPADDIKRLKTVIKHVRKDAFEFLAECDRWVQEHHAAAPANYQVAYRDYPFTAGTALARFECTIGELLDCVIELQKKMRGSTNEPGDMAGDTLSSVERTSQLKADLAYLAAGRTEDHVFWIEGDREKGWVKLCGVPLDIGELLAGIWGTRTSAAIFTSATLSVLGTSDYFCEKAGLKPHHSGKVIFEHFGVTFSPGQVLRCAVRSPFEPDNDGYARYVADSVAELLAHFEKNILVLFTSNTMLASVYGALKGHSRLPADATVLAQHLSGSRQVMLDLFKRSRRTALLGADSFWEGIDAPGGECEMVVIPRLPFQVPSHPLTLAVAKRYEERDGDSFCSYAIPEAIIRFRQGAGRLIRTEKDRGVFIVLDKRIIEKGYGKKFTRALGGEFIFSDTTQGMIERIDEFFA